ncbi:aldehyde dehydrogenase [Iodidimonas gelatinilytica]|uniref:aldehyde dehydrogenase (NAD(+)) n=1 Tax=Iodidimonas gelatinilytica TaxID=1236966 RepID=A0A5A7MRN3_9PROT|nr:aldehyde dehydrogenase family protein [Iodidimonas gelatinilytica]GEQ98620.1 aldehyde dehydrogenase [Iodidimonas gelatinilytica]GER01817.1 aldehyde dehydrogenase [Iodidimonas gelatinilytica]
MTSQDLLTALHLDPTHFAKGELAVTSPIDGAVLGHVDLDSPQTVSAKIGKATDAFASWRAVPGPQRGELVRLLGEELRDHKEALGRLVSAECGKILEEGKGEVQEMIDICDFAVGLSRQLYGLTIASERPGHAMRETWQPLGPVGVISAFNFPVAVWSWNTALALVCGDPVIWKPSEKTPLTALACQALFERAVKRFGAAPEGLSQVIIGAADVGEAMVDDPRLPLISATGSCAMGRKVGPRVAARFGRCLLELGGNNAIIVTPSADLDLAVRGIVFGAVGTAGQRCTSTRRLIVHESVYDTLMPRLKKAYDAVTVGNPLEGALVGPLIDKASFDGMERALEKARKEGGTVHGGGRVLEDKYPNAYYARPALVDMPKQAGVMVEETFAPILYVVTYSTLDEAIALQNGVPQGLSSAIFTNDVREAERYLSATGSDCGIANVNIGTSGAEIGGAFGGEKDTGGGRESGSDAWKVYMRRQTSTVNYSTDLPLAQGIKFDI